MICSKCGGSNDPNAFKCLQCGEILQRTVESEGVSNHLVQAIMVTVCCCLPFGIVSIVYAAQVNGKVALGDLVAAREYSQKAKLWAWVGFGCGAIGSALYFILVMIGALAGGK
jgi:hypothetical protein